MKDWFLIGENNHEKDNRDGQENQELGCLAFSEEKSLLKLFPVITGAVIRSLNIPAISRFSRTLMEGLFETKTSPTTMREYRWSDCTTPMSPSARP